MSIFPFFEEQENQNDSLPIFAEYAYDFNEKKFLRKSGKEYLVFKDEALKIWITKALLTERAKYDAYEDNFGNEIYKIIGVVKDIEVLRLEVKRYIIETLMVNPYILEIDDFKIFEDEEKKEVVFNVKTIYNSFKFKGNMEM